VNIYQVGAGIGFDLQHWRYAA